MDVIRDKHDQEKYDELTLVLRNTTKVEAQVAKLKKAKKTKKIVITAAAGQKIKASQFYKKAFKKFQGQDHCQEERDDKKQFRKLKKSLERAASRARFVTRNNIFLHTIV